MENLKKYWILIFIVFVFFLFYEPKICYIIFGILLATIGIISWNFMDNIKKNGIKSIGRIVCYESDSDGDRTPIIVFKTENGEQIKRKPYSYSSTSLDLIGNYQNKINESVMVLYDKMNPEKFVLSNQRKLNYISSILITFLGLIFLAVGIVNLMEILNFSF